MNRAGKQHPLETLLEWVAPLPLAAAVAWAMRAVGFEPASFSAAAGAAFAAGVVFIKKAGSGIDGAIREFEPATFEPDELLLEEKDALLELTDPLVEVDPDSRVIRLFARQKPTPGELVDRITDFLGEGRRSTPELPTPSASPVDASAALHAALANIRASLR